MNRPSTWMAKREGDDEMHELLEELSQELAHVKEKSEGTLSKCRVRATVA